MDTPPPGRTRLGRLDVLLIRHAAPVLPGESGHADDDRPLTADGRAAAQELADELAAFGLSAVYSSPHRRSLETVELIAEGRDLEVQVIDDLRERVLSPEPLDDWRDHLARAWADPEYAYPGGESGRIAQRRGIGVLDLLRIRHPDGGRVVVGSHGNLIGLILQAVEPRVDFDFWDAMPMPAVYWLEHDGLAWQLMGGHGVERFG